MPAAEAPAKSSAFSLSSLLGDKLKGKDGTFETESVKSKFIGLYFSAHWCPPCRGFTPKLAEFYKSFKSNHPSKEDFEIIFISSDKDQESFDSYYAEMPWLALPFDQRDLKAKLSSKYKVQGIPSFVVIDALAGTVVNGNARNQVAEDPEGKDFPWKPKTASELLSVAELIDKEGKKFKSDDLLAGKIKMLYFSAHWCPPCRKFTPQLAETYTKLKAAGKDFELVFFSSDRDQGSFDAYLSEMPWPALVWSDRKRKEELSEAFKVSGIPTLVVLDEHNRIITSRGRGVVASDPEGLKFPWYPEPFSLLDESSVDIVNEAPTVIYISGAESADVDKRGKDVLEKAALKSKGEIDSGKKEEGLGFLYGPSKGSEVMESVLSFAGVNVEEGKDALIILDVPNQCLYKLEGSVISAEAVEKFIADFEAGQLPKIKLGQDEDDE